MAVCNIERAYKDAKRVERARLKADNAALDHAAANAYASSSKRAATEGTKSTAPKRKR